MSKTQVRGLLVSTFLLSQPLELAARRTRLTWINGVGYSLETGKSEKKKISRLFGYQKVHFCHNPTAMVHGEDMLGYASDLAQAGTQKLGRLTAEVDSLVEHLRKNLAAVGKRGTVVHIAHSQGALITSLAILRLTADEMQRMEVLAFGGAAALRKTPETPFRRCINYYSINDPLLYIVPSATQTLRSGFVNDDDEFCFLSPRVGDPVEDHYLLSPTYAQALTWEGIRFQRQYQNPLSRSVRLALIATASVSDNLCERIRAVLKVLLRPILLWCILCYRSAVHLHHSLKERVYKPALLVLALFIEWLGAVLRSMKGEDKYVPVSEIIGKKSNNKQRKKS